MKSGSTESPRPGDHGAAPRTARGGRREEPRSKFRKESQSKTTLFRSANRAGGARPTSSERDEKQLPVKLSPSSTRRLPISLFGSEHRAKSRSRRSRKRRQTRRLPEKPSSRGRQRRAARGVSPKTDAARPGGSRKKKDTRRATAASRRPGGSRQDTRRAAASSRPPAEGRERTPRAQRPRGSATGGIQTPRESTGARRYQRRRQLTARPLVRSPLRRHASPRSPSGGRRRSSSGLALPSSTSGSPPPEDGATRPPGSLCTPSYERVLDVCARTVSRWCGRVGTSCGPVPRPPASGASPRALPRPRRGGAGGERTPSQRTACLVLREPPGRAASVFQTRRSTAAVDVDGNTMSLITSSTSRLTWRV